MKIALFGKGKTGCEVANIAGSHNIIGPFGKDIKQRFKELEAADMVISFVPGDAFLENIDLLIESGLPVVSGATGLTYPPKLDETLKEKDLTWIHGANFSLGMSIMRWCLKIFSQAPLFLENTEYSMHEIHHTQKLDAPSGTALRWQEWLKRDTEITHERQSDIKGIHDLTLETPFEKMNLRHESKDRKLFAEGALWAAKQIRNCEPGLIAFEYLTDQWIKDGIYEEFK